MFPRLIEIGNFGLPTYGFMAALGLIAGLAVVVRGAKKSGINPDQAWNLGILAILSAIIGAKLLLIVNSWDWYLAHPREIFSLAVLQAGGVFLGGVVAAVIVCVWYVRKTGLPVLRTADVFAPALALGHALGRIGCFAAGCCYGKHTDLPWGVTFTHPLAQAFSGTPLGIPLHPTQLYEFVLEIFNFALLWWMLPRKQFDGQVAGTYLFIYGIARFFIEFVRGDPERGDFFKTGLSVTQVLAILLVIGGGVLWMRWGQRRTVAAKAAR